MQGSIVNRILERATNGQPIPTVGMGCTQMMYSDRHAYTVVEILSKPGMPVTRIRAQRDFAKRTDGNGMSECQEYEYTPDPKAPKETLRLNKFGQWKREGDPRGSSYRMGVRAEYYDFSF